MLLHVFLLIGGFFGLLVAVLVGFEEFVCRSPTEKIGLYSLIFSIISLTWFSCSQSFTQKEYETDYISIEDNVAYAKIDGKTYNMNKNFNRNFNWGEEIRVAQYKDKFLVGHRDGFSLEKTKSEIIKELY